MSSEQVFLARNYFERGNSAKALGLLEQCNVQSGNSEDISAVLLLVDVLHDLDRSDEARELIEQLLANFPEDEDVIDGAISLFSCAKESAKDAEELALQRMKRMPESCWSYYILAHIYFYHLNEKEEKVISNIDKALELNNFTYYLDKAYSIYDYYNYDEKRDFCLEQMILSQPDTLKTRAKLFHNLYEKKEYREAAEVALQFFKDFPASDEISRYSVEDLKGELAKTDQQRKRSERKEKIYAYYNDIVNHKSLFVRLTGGTLLRLLYVIIFPYLLPDLISSKNYIHIAAVKRDELYRKLCSSRDHLIEKDERVLLYCPDSDGELKVILFEKNGLHAGADLLCPISAALGEFNKEKFLKPKSYKRRSIKNFCAESSKFSLETTWSLADLEYSSPETVEALEKSLRNLNWKPSGNRVWELVGVFFCVKFMFYVSIGVGVLVTKMTFFPPAIIYAAGIPFYWMCIYIRGVIASSRTFSYRPGRG